MEYSPFMFIRASTSKLRIAKLLPYECRPKGLLYDEILINYLVILMCLQMAWVWGYSLLLLFIIFVAI